MRGASIVFVAIALAASASPVVERRQIIGGQNGVGVGGVGAPITNALPTITPPAAPTPITPSVPSNGAQGGAQAGAVLTNLASAFASGAIAIQQAAGSFSLGSTTSFSLAAQNIDDFESAFQAAAQSAAISGSSTLASSAAAFQTSLIAVAQSIETQSFAQFVFALGQLKSGAMTLQSIATTQSGTAASILASGAKSIMTAITTAQAQLATVVPTPAAPSFPTPANNKRQLAPPSVPSSGAQAGALAGAPLTLLAAQFALGAQALQDAVSGMTSSGGMSFASALTELDNFEASFQSAAQAAALSGSASFAATLTAVSSSIASLPGAYSPLAFQQFAFATGQLASALGTFKTIAATQTGAGQTALMTGITTLQTSASYAAAQLMGAASTLTASGN